MKQILSFLKAINKPIIFFIRYCLIRYATENIAEMNAIVDSFIVMTHASAKLLEQDYGILKIRLLSFRTEHIW
jgi:hypothetical protein